MNVSYRVVWNGTTGTWIVASELAKGRTKKSTKSALTVALLAASGSGVAGGLDLGSTAGSSAGDEFNNYKEVSYTHDQLAAFGGGVSPFSDSVSPLVTKDDAEVASLDEDDSGSDEAPPSVSLLGVSDGASYAASNATAVGPLANASGTYSVAVGNLATSSGAGSVAVGASSIASRSNSIAIGSGARASGTNSIAIGANAFANHDNSIAIGADSATGRANAVAFSNGANTRQLTHVGAGTMSTDAVNVSQLETLGDAVATTLGSQTSYDAATNTWIAPTYTMGESNTVFNTVGGALENLDGRTITNTTAISNITNQINDGTIGLVKQDKDSRQITVAGETDGTEVVFTNRDGADRKLTGVAAGDVNATSTDAVNGSQLFAATGDLTTHINDVDGRVTNVNIKTDNLGSAIASTIGSNASYDPTTGWSNPNFDHLDGSAPGTITTVGDALEHLDNRIGATSDGAVMYDSAAKDVVTLGGAAATAPVTLKNVAAGDVNATSTDAVNGSQLYGTAKSIADHLGGGAGVATDGTVTQPTYTLGETDTPLHTVGEALENLDGRTITNTIAISNVTNQINDGTIGLVKQDKDSRQITVAGETDGTEVIFTNRDGADRKLTGVAAGDISATSNQAINGSQLYGTAQSIADHLGGGAGVATDGTVTQPTYTLGETDTPLHTVGEALENLDGRTITNTTNINNLQEDIDSATRYFKANSSQTGTAANASGTDAVAIGLSTTAGAADSVALGKGASVSHAGSMALGANSIANGTTLGNAAYLVGGTANREVSFGHSGQAARLTNVAAGANDTDAANVAQLKNLDTKIIMVADNAVQYDSITKDMITLAGVASTNGGLTNGTRITNLRQGALNDTSTDAVNGAQLHATNTRVAVVEGDITTINTSINGLGGNLDDLGSAIASTIGSNASYDPTTGWSNPNFDHLDGSAPGTITTVGDALEHLDNRIGATSDGAVMYDSAAKDVVTLGGAAATAPVTLKNVAAGVDLNDAVNVGQLDSSISTVTNTFNSAISTVGGDLDNLGAAMAAQLGGTVAYDPATHTLSPADYRVVNQTYTDVDSAIEAVDGGLTNLQSQINNLGSGGTGLVRHDVANNRITVAADVVGATEVSFAGNGAARKLTGVAAGDVNATSTDAVNGSQLFAATGDLTTQINNSETRVTTRVNDLGEAMEATFGGSAAYDEASGTWTAPSFAVRGQTAGTVTEAFDLVEGGFTKIEGDLTTINTQITDRVHDLGHAIAGQLGGTVAYDETAGTLSPADYRVVNQTYTDVDSAIEAVDGGLTNLQSQVNNLGSGGTGLVRHDVANNRITVAADVVGATEVSFAGNGMARKLTGVAAGDVNATSTDAVNGSQLFAATGDLTTQINDVDGRVTNVNIKTDNLGSAIASTIGSNASYDPTTGWSNPNFDHLDGSAPGTITTVGDALEHLDNRIGATSDGAVMYDSAAKDVVTLGGAAATAPVTLKNLADGVDSNDAVNVGQLDSSISTVTNTFNSAITNVGGDLDNLGAAMAAQLGGTVAYDPATNTLSPADYRVINQTYTDVDSAIEAVDGGLTNLQTQISNINNGMTGLVKHDAANNRIIVAADVVGATEVGFAGNGMARKLTGVAKGDVSATSTDAVNGSQLYDTAQSIADHLGGGAGVATDGTVTPPTYTMGETDTPLHTVGGALENLDGRTITNTTHINTLQDTLKGAVMYDDATARDRVTFGTAGTAVTLSNVADGQDDNDAVNLSQLRDASRGTDTSIDNLGSELAAAMGGDAAYDPVTNTWTKPAFAIAGAPKTYDNAHEAFAHVGDRLEAGQAQANKLGETTAKALGGATAYDPVTGALTGTSFAMNSGTETYDNVTEALANVDGRTTSNTAAISNITNQINDGTIGLVKQDKDNRQITVAGETDGTEVVFTNRDGIDRKLTGVAAGDVNATSNEAINGSQLYGTAKSIADVLGGSATVDENGKVADVKFRVGEQDYYTVDSAFGAIQTGFNNGTIGLVRQTQDGVITVARETGGNEVSITGQDGDRKLTGVKAGQIAAGSTDAVNGDQLHATNERVGVLESRVDNVENKISNIEGDVTNIKNDIQSGNVGLVKQDETTRVISVAQDRDGTEINMAGKDGNRTLSGVAAGTVSKDSTEAINGSQLHGMAESTASALGGGAKVNENGTISAPSYTVGGKSHSNVGSAIGALDSRIDDWGLAMNNKIDEVDRQAAKGIAAASALMITAPYMPGKTAINAGVASYRGQAALGVGVSRWSDNGRINFNAGVSASKGDQPIFRVGVGILLGD